MNKGEELFSIKKKKYGRREIVPDVKLNMSKCALKRKRLIFLNDTQTINRNRT